MLFINPKRLEGNLGHFQFQEPNITNDNISSTNSNNNPSTSPIADSVNESGPAPEVYPLFFVTIVVLNLTRIFKLKIINSCLFVPIV